jgi:hypothetical protein
VSSRPGQQGGRRGATSRSREARVRALATGENDHGHEVAAAGAYSTSTACALGEADRGHFVGGEKRCLHCDKTRGTSTPVRRTRAALAGARAGEPPTDRRTERGVYGRRGSLDVSGRGLWGCVTRWEGAHRGADAEASRAWRGRGRARVGAPGECSYVGLALFDHVLLQKFE